MQGGRILRHLALPKHIFALRLELPLKQQQMRIIDARSKLTDISASIRSTPRNMLMTLILPTLCTECGILNTD